jgi:hypothetical protein
VYSELSSRPPVPRPRVAAFFFSLPQRSNLQTCKRFNAFCSISYQVPPNFYPLLSFHAVTKRKFSNSFFLIFIRVMGGIPPSQRFKNLRTGNFSARIGSILFRFRTLRTLLLHGRNLSTVESTCSTLFPSPWRWGVLRLTRNSQKAHLPRGWSTRKLRMRRFCSLLHFPGSRFGGSTFQGGSLSDRNGCRWAREGKD